jgi:hypothetical protein
MSSLFFSNAPLPFGAEQIAHQQYLEALNFMTPIFGISPHMTPLACRNRASLYLATSFAIL